jgi:hypothetical protein
MFNITLVKQIETGYRIGGVSLEKLERKFVFPR